MKNTKQKGSIIKIILIIFFILGIGSVIYVKHESTKLFNDFIINDKQTLINQVDAFIKNVGQGDVSDAYKLTDQKNISLEMLQNSEMREALQKYEKQDSNFHSIRVIRWLSNDSKVEYKTVIYFSDKTQGQMGIVAIKEKGLWKIAGFELATPPDKMW
ncbi:DUF4878 domain-containing protein [Arenimonas sp.]|nr:DUF4878 domain-containing protein [Candidatus Parcubacteria bacterium]